MMPFAAHSSDDLACHQATIETASEHNGQQQDRCLFLLERNKETI